MSQTILKKSLFFSLFLSILSASIVTADEQKEGEKNKSEVELTEDVEEGEENKSDADADDDEAKKEAKKNTLKAEVEADIASKEAALNLNGSFHYQLNKEGEDARYVTFNLIASNPINSALDFEKIGKDFGGHAESYLNGKIKKVSVKFEFIKNKKQELDVVIQRAKPSYSEEKRVGLSCAYKNHDYQIELEGGLHGGGKENVPSGVKLLTLKAQKKNLVGSYGLTVSGGIVFGKEFKLHSFLKDSMHVDAFKYIPGLGLEISKDKENKDSVLSSIKVSFGGYKTKTEIHSTTKETTETLLSKAPGLKFNVDFDGAVVKRLVADYLLSSMKEWDNKLKKFSVGVNLPVSAKFKEDISKKDEKAEHVLVDLGHRFQISASLAFEDVFTKDDAISFGINFLCKSSKHYTPKYKSGTDEKAKTDTANTFGFQASYTTKFNIFG
ncbi:MAG: hypothetical protein AAF380_00970 [Bacteroidota bacterium]